MGRRHCADHGVLLRRGVTAAIRSPRGLRRSGCCRSNSSNPPSGQLPARARHSTPRFEASKLPL
ncbi:unnamed protein product [Symbiodinium pilosum]|uniref:Uncharacterized protein n=1 Tax=Symbiodinium pilosum TaxID=2952 RepID=A0A812LYY8_SYMPI|nr:unnamed protein product [Symbiodinium pilosum]